MQDRCARRERGGVHHQGHQRHKEGPGVPAEGPEEEDHDAAVCHHRRQSGNLHGAEVHRPRLVRNSDLNFLCRSSRKNFHSYIIVILLERKIS